jgi:cellulose biosynthesis protein BcsQ
MAVSKVIVALSHKGGVGKSTVLSSVAYAIRKETHWRVVYVDVTADGLGSSLLAPGCRVEYGTYAFLAGADVLHYCTIEDGAYVDTVPPGPLPSNSQLRGSRFRELVDMLRIDYNLIFVDLPGTDEVHSDVIRTAINVADIYFLIAEPATVHLLWRLKDMLPQGKPIFAVLNKYLDSMPGKNEIQRIGTTKYGTFAFTIPLEGPVYNAVLEGKIPAGLSRVKFVEAIDQIAAKLQYFIADVR